ncbi:glycoside hydrolase family 65 protein [Poritiphilus flavus]|uniref:Glycoside hydrolase family 65 protein n=1 Tax=Poritiphilus flavus TaxID=2697053 RepID=A0A6L9EHI3_9FLAO|nr:glycosyl hydrolase family 65 protein [Poritiphilus flavus]NAS14234.1 glycoside hydrolase family 65 protein [Poritiphilus flavus]
MKLKNNLRTETGWEIIENSFDPDQLVTTGSNFMIGNGYLGYRGTFEEWEAREYVACVVTDTWDQAEGSQWSELCNVPNGLFTQLFVDNDMFSAFSGKTEDYYRALDLRHGLNQRKLTWRSPKGKKVALEVEKFASLVNHHLISMSYRFKALHKGRYRLLTGIDGKVWSINGEHFKSYTPIQEENLIGFNLKTSESGSQVVVCEGLKINGGHVLESEVIEDSRRILREFVFELEADEEIHIHKLVSVTHANEVKNPKEVALAEVEEGLKQGHDRLKKAHQSQWDDFWTVSDIRISGNEEAQVLARFNLYQAFIATPRHANLPIGARGLSCQVYQGAAFWDQETFNLKMFIYTHPEIARRLVTYRHDTLDGARRKAKNLGYYGAFYAWTSGKTGDELFPDYFFTDVLTGRKIRNHFNCWQIHISPDVVYGIWSYYEATGDWDFMLNHGAEVLFEVSQFLVSRVHFKKDKNRYELIRLLGPDEYHENVDNNAYTNYLSRYALQKAVIVYREITRRAPERMEELERLTGISENSPETWKEIADLIYIPEADTKTGVIEQFDGYFQLEDVRPDQVRKRLIDPGEYWGWPNGVAIATQVLKQADVIQLLALMGGFPEKVLTANYEYYEPRTEHGSSLSPSVHALVAVKAGHHEEAYRYFLEAATIDLYNASKKVLSGGSFLGGIHTAAAGGVWLIIVEGFAGFQVTEEGIRFKPALPESWNSLAFSLKVKNCLLDIQLNPSSITVKSTAQNGDNIKIFVDDEVALLQPGQTAIL